MTAIAIEALKHQYGKHVALDDVSLTVSTGEIFGLLGPNGSGKTTLFRVLSTLIPMQQGQARILGLDLRTQRSDIQRRIGVVFQSPSLDRQLTAAENLRHHGHLYGLSGAALDRRIVEVLDRFSLADRAGERVSVFSGGMRRRVELAKGLLTRPDLLILDEPSTGLDPSARIELWKALRDIQRKDGVSIILTTHLMEEADHCDKLAILSRGKLVACDSPDALRSQIGGDIITLSAREPEKLQELLKEKLLIEAERIGPALRIERPDGHQFIPRLIESAPGLIDSVSVGKPTLEDVFIHLTGHCLSEDQRAASMVDAQRPH